MNDGCFTIIVLGLFILVAILFESITGYLQCTEVGKTLNYKTEWHYWTGCVVEKPSGERILLKQMRAWEGEK